MMTAKEKEEKIILYMNKLDLSREEAEQLIEDDENDEIGEEGELMTEKAKEVKRYEKSTKERKKAGSSSPSCRLILSVKSFGRPVIPVPPSIPVPYIA